jgi:hypothetical protein
MTEVSTDSAERRPVMLVEFGLVDVLRASLDVLCPRHLYCS